MFAFLRSFLQTLRGRLVTAFLVAVLLPLLGTALYGNWVTSKIIQERALENAHADTLRRASQIRDFLQGVEADVHYLASLDDLRKLFYADQTQNTRDFLLYRQNLAREFFIFTSTHPSYYQVRYINARGQEVVRVDSDGRDARIVPWDELQNKADRYYFTETMALEAGRLYVSSLDLNREHGRIETPYKPVIRYAVPVDYLGERRGIVIINVYGDAFLDFLQGSSAHQRMMLVDSSGYYLYHPDESRRWGGPRDLDSGYRLDKDYSPQVAQQVLNGKPGVVSTRDEALAFAPVLVSANPQPRSWTVIRAESRRALFAPIADFRRTAGIILAVAIFFAGVMVLGIARHFTRPIETLQSAVRAFAETARYAPLPVTRNDEIGLLTGEFNRMARLLQTHISQLERLNEAGKRMMATLERAPAQQAVLQAVRSILPCTWAALTICVTDELCRPTAQCGEGPPPDAEARLQLHARARQEGRGFAHLPSGWTLYCAHLPISDENAWYLEAAGTHPDLRQPVMQNLFAALTTQASIALENVLLYERLSQHKKRLSQLLNALIRAQEDERKMVAYDLHDGLIQDLVGVRLCLSNFVVWREQSPELAGEALERGRQQLTCAIREARRLLQGLRPTLLDDLGLLTALRELARETTELGGWELTLSLPDPETMPPLEEAIDMTAFRIVQEAFANILKHAKASTVRLEVRVDDSLRLIIEDDGLGFEADSPVARSRHAIGLNSMRERASLVGGRCDIESAPGKGTRVSVRLPFSLQEE